MGGSKNELQQREGINLKKYALTGIAIVLLAFLNHVYGQSPVGELRGRIVDQTSFEPLPGAQIFLEGAQNTFNSIANPEGYFVIDEVPVGRYILGVRFIGYAPYAEEVLVKAGSDRNINISLKSTPETLEEVTIKGAPFTIGEEINTRTVSIEQATRFAANYLDPARVMTSFPGLVVQNDQNNNLIVNGKSPNGILWRVEGLDIINPNHLSNAGTITDQPTQAGGGVNMLSAQMLDATSFIGAPFRANYGNAYSGIMDMRFRDGNNFEREYTAQASLIGLDFAAEGPISEGRSSYLANYRYSTVGLLSQLGVDFGGEEIAFQDLSLKVNFDHQNGGDLVIFAFGGLSDNDFNGVENNDEWEEDKDSTQVYYGSKTGAFGFKDYRNISSRASLSYGSAISYAQNERTSFGILSGAENIPAEDFLSTNILSSTSVELDYSISRSSNLKLGLMANAYFEELKSKNFLREDSVLFNTEIEAIMWQPYVQYNLLISNKSKVSGGVRYMNFDNSGAGELLPNVSYDYSINSKTTFSFNLARQAQRQSIQVLSLASQDLDLTVLDYGGAALTKVIRSTLFTTEFFYQRMTNLAVTEEESAYAAINELSYTIPESGLVNGGEAQFYGANVSYERPFDGNYYYLVSGSFYDANYTPSDGIQREVRFSGNYSLAVTGGKEWRKSKAEDKVNFTGVHTRLLVAGGIGSPAINENASRISGRTVFDISDGYPVKLGNYLRWDLRVSWRKEKPEYTRILSIDIQNVLSIENDAYRYFDFRQDRIVTKKQLGIIPVIVYRIEF